MWVDLTPHEIEDCPKLLSDLIEFGKQIEDPSFKFLLAKLVTTVFFFFLFLTINAYRFCVSPYK